MAKKVYTSSVPRANETWKEVAKEMNLNWQEQVDVKIRSKLWFLNTEYYPPKVLEEFMSCKEKGMTDKELVSNFLDGKRESQPKDLAEWYLKDMKLIFDRVIRSNKSLNIIAFRHGEKDQKWQLTHTWYEQARELWRNLDAQNDLTDDTIYIATHNAINESIITSLFWRENLPESRLEPISFTERVEYTFVPNLKWWWVMTITMRWKTFSITNKEFDKRITLLYSSQA